MSGLFASRTMTLLEHFRVPYTVESANDGLERVGLEKGAALVWPAERGRCGAYRVGSLPIFGRLGDDSLVPSDRNWKPQAPIVDESGAEVAWIRRADDGSIFLPFDPDELVRSFWSEAYLKVASGGFGRAAKTAARRSYYAVRPLIPRGVQLALRRRFRRVQEQAVFPRWPVETALHDLCRLLLGFVDEIAGERVPRLAAWPEGRQWALVLTHDVEMTPGYEYLDSVLEVEREAGLRSACFFVPERDYRVDEVRLRELTANGFEVGVHGLRHDGRDLTAGVFERRLPAMRHYAARWQAVGFRSPATQRHWELMQRLAFDYDTSYSDVARYEPQPGGCCSWFPFFIGDVVELPITLPMDHTLFELLRHRDGTLWAEKTAFLKERGGMALMLTHPDYLLDRERLDVYRRFLGSLAADRTVWHALPREVSAWWRRRAASRIERYGDGWRVVGPASSEARIELGPLAG
ncbi:MAG: hypothetical protein E6G67_10695 [Actinobacteria bacterium]|nr:MAG: hypothetical protein E6G67_10695 [Actinomycetota bacterium]